MKRHKSLTLVGLDAIRIDEEPPDLEIVRQHRNCTSLDSPEVGNFSTLSDYDLEDAICKYQKHLHDIKMVDGNVKLMLHLEKLEKERARRQSQQQQTGSQVLVIDDANALSCLPSELPSTLSNVTKGSQQGVDCDVIASEIRRPSQFSDEECSLLSPESKNGESMAKSSLRADDRGNEMDDPDLDRSPSGVRHEVCLSCHKVLLDSNISFHAKESPIRRLCTQCKKETICSPATVSTPIDSELCLHESPGEPSSRRLGMPKRGHGAIGGTPDTAMELSDDEENHKEISLTLVSQTWGSSHTPRRQGLRSAFKRRARLKVAYPSSDDPEAVEVQYTDLQHLSPREFLNDTVIDFYIKYIQVEKFSSPEKAKHFHFFNSFFYKKLTTAKAKGSDGFLKLHKWTKGTNIFEKTYLLVPIHDSAHWSLAIVCFQRRENLNHFMEPAILHLDSMTPTSGHASQDIFKVLKSYLEAEWRYVMHDKNAAQGTLKVVPSKIIHKRIQVPLQDNEWDCGLFMLYYIERFVQEAPVHCNLFEIDEMFGRSWFKPNEASQLREIIYKLLESLFDQQSHMIQIGDSEA